MSYREHSIYFKPRNELTCEEHIILKRDGILQVPICALQYGKRLREMDGWDEIKREHPTLMNDIVEYMLGLVEIA